MGKMSSTKTDHFFRLLTLLFEGPTKTLLDFFLKKAGCTFSTLNTYLNSHQSFLQNNLPPYQYDRLFRPEPKFKKKIFDISLSHNLLTKLSHLSNQEYQWITHIKDISDNLSHRCDSFEIDETDFLRMWRGIMDATNGLAGQISQSYLQEMTDIVEAVKQRSLPPPGPYVEILKDWLGTMNGTINKLRDDMKNLKKSGETSTSILENAVHVSKRKGEPATKRMKMLGSNLEKMQGSFKKTMQKIPDAFTAPTEADEMYKKLNESKQLYAVGSQSSLYLQTTLHVIKGFGIDINRCVEMTECSDWEDVNSDDVDLILFRDPFGIGRITSERTRRTHDCLDDIDKEIGRVPLKERMFVIITSDYDVHLQYMDKCCQEPHHILTDVVLFQAPTREEYPHLVMDARPSLTLGKDEYGVLKTLQEQTKVYIDYNACQGFSTQRFEDAKAILRKRKMLAISGPRNSGKTSLATKLMALYSSDRRVLLQSPTDMRYIRFGDVSLVLVEDFTGKYEPNKQTAFKWYGVFDVLLPAVLSGKLSVIIVSEAESFRRCELPTHGLLRYDITLVSPEQPVIKLLEPVPHLATGDANMMANASTRRISQRKSLRNATFEQKKTFPAAREEGHVKACTLMPSGHIIIAYNDCVALMDINFVAMTQEYISHVVGIATVNDTNVIITRGDQYLQYMHVNLSVSHPSFTLGERIDVGENVTCKGIDVNDNDIYVLCLKCARSQSEIRVLNIWSGVIHNTISLDASEDVMFVFKDIKVSPNNDKVFVFSGMSVTCINTRGDIVYKYSPGCNTTGGMYVDNEDTVLVCNIISNTISLIDTADKKMKVVLNESDGILLPRCLCYREVDSCIVVVCTNDILTFKVNYLHSPSPLYR